jgi:hypothetical protein
VTEPVFVVKGQCSPEELAALIVVLGTVLSTSDIPEAEDAGELAQVRALVPIRTHRAAGSWSSSGRRWPPAA